MTWIHLCAWRRAQDEELREQLTLDGIVTVVNAAHLEQHLDEDKPEGVENEVSDGMWSHQQSL